MIEHLLQTNQQSNLPSWMPLLISLTAPFVFNFLQVFMFQPFYIARLRLMVQFRPPQNKLIIENTKSSFHGSSLSMPFYYWSGISPSSTSEPLIVRKLAVVRPFIIGTFLAPIQYTGIYDAISRIYKEEGLCSLYTGWRFRFLVLSMRTLSSFISIDYDDENSNNVDNNIDENLDNFKDNEHDF